MTSSKEIETGNFAVPRFWICPPDSIRVVNWNIDRGLQLERVIEFLARAEADILFLQEADLNARRTHHLNIAREIAQKLAMNYVFGREFQELTQGSRTSPAYHGQATLSRWPLSNSRIIRFERQSNFWRPRWFLPDVAPFQERIGGRLALMCEASVAGRMIVTYNLHLESRGDDRLRCAQLDEVLHDAKRYAFPTPVLVAGDLNFDVSDGPASLAISQAEFRDAFESRHVPTTPHSLFSNGRTIDWIFARGPIRTGQARVYGSVSASDHYPLSVDLTLAGQV